MGLTSLEKSLTGCVLPTCVSRIQTLTHRTIPPPQALKHLTHVASKFYKNLFSLHSSPAAASLYHSRFGRNLRYPSKVRWWSFFESMSGVLPFFPELGKFLDDLEASGKSPETTQALHVRKRSVSTVRMCMCGRANMLVTMYTYIQSVWKSKHKDLIDQTAALKLIGDIVLPATYLLEGDSFLLPFVQEQLDKVNERFTSFITNGTIPRDPKKEVTLVLDEDSEHSSGEAEDAEEPKPKKKKKKTNPLPTLAEFLRSAGRGGDIRALIGSTSEFQVP